MSALQEGGSPEAPSEQRSADAQPTESHPGRAFVPPDRQPKEHFPNLLPNGQRVWMKKAKPVGGYEPGWFGPMIVVAAQQRGALWEYQLRFHTEEALYRDGAWIPKKDLSISTPHTQSQAP
ncbi:hypothetical protein GJ744_012300 [Endocarpon pusillum]|uniref:Uncharacterized protein n=1 Tax=Endocarpon pusillum TaxID=364733 RepID=A0A8H7E2T5_9EURO|nr:hypothetical protein GJ744_012300 [Endocarpon pusillum]